MATTSKIRCSTRDISTVLITGLAAGGATQGAWIHQANFVGMWLMDRDSDSEATLMYRARRVQAPFDTALATQGDSIYWHETDGDFVVSGANVTGPVGTLLEDKAAATLVAEIELMGDLGARDAEVTI
jgi:hypothetical protein|tara:strand:- start:4848 stop:5231 length:384 start_codon:yes stop_codon:yes gene_type:complete